MDPDLLAGALFLEDRKIVALCIALLPDHAPLFYMVDDEGSFKCALCEEEWPWAQHMSHLRTRHAPTALHEHSKKPKHLQVLW